MDATVEEPTHPPFSCARAPIVEAKSAEFVPVKYNFHVNFDINPFLGTVEQFELTRLGSIKKDKNNKAKTTTKKWERGTVDWRMTNKLKLSPNTTSSKYMDVFFLLFHH